MDDLRAFFATAPLPATLSPAPHMHIINVPLFVSTHIARLDSDSRVLQRLAVANLTALKNLLTKNESET